MSDKFKTVQHEIRYHNSQVINDKRYGPGNYTRHYFDVFGKPDNTALLNSLHQYFNIDTPVASDTGMEGSKAKAPAENIFIHDDKQKPIQSVFLHPFNVEVLFVSDKAVEGSPDRDCFQIHVRDNVTGKQTVVYEITK